MNDQYLIEIRLRRSDMPSFDDYPFALPAVRALSSLELHPAVTFIVGDNGAGKSTLLEAIAVAWGFNPEGGTKNLSFKTRPSHSELWKYLTLSRGVRRARDGFFLRAESFYNVASAIDRIGVEDSYGGVSLHAQSHGESFLALITKRFGGSGLYILDEPEAALSPTTQMSFITRMHQLVGQSSQFIIATHSPIVMAYPNATIYQLEGDELTSVQYTETEHYTVARDFLTHHERMLKLLME